jgi:hypothetical protein
MSGVFRINLSKNDIKLNFLPEVTPGNEHLDNLVY